MLLSGWSLLRQDRYENSDRDGSFTQVGFLYLAIYFKLLTLISNF